MVITTLRRLALPVCLAATAAVFAPAAHSAPILGAPVTTASEKPEGVVLADLNEDGFDDAIVGTRFQQSIQIARGSANGLGTSTLLPVGMNLAAWVTTGDLNRDGHVDVVVSNAVGGLNGKVAVLLGDGAGGLAPAAGSPFATGIDGPPSQDALKVADITGDGNPDVVTGDEGSLLVLPGNGTGALGAPAVTSTQFTNILGIAIGDFVGDARLDVMTSSAQPAENSELFKNTGGTLSFNSIVTETGNRVVAGDVNGAGRSDAVFSQIAGKDLATVLSTGDGVFTDPPIASKASMNFVAGMALGDLDADGINDLAVGGQGQVEVMRGSGTGTFQPFAAPVVSPTNPDEVAFGDVDGDGQTDLVFTDFDASAVTLARNVQTATATGPAGVDFGRNSTPGSGAVERTITLTAQGPGFYRTSGASVSGSPDISVVADGCKTKRQRTGSTCDIVLRLTPSASGELSGKLVVTDNSEAGSRSIPLSGFVNNAPTSPLPVPTPDTTSPSVSKLSLSRSTFSVAKGSSAKNVVGKKGTKIRFTLSEAARVTLTFERQTAGLRRGKSCVLPTTKLRKAKAKKCVRYVRDGVIVRDALPQGAATVAFTGRIGKKALKVGRHRVTISARDAAGNTTKSPARKTFRVVRTAKKK